jgi:hypothetical protein
MNNDSGVSWENLPQKKQQFYVKLSELEFLQTDFVETQSFYKERIAKIKSDSNLYFNNYTVRNVIQEYIEKNPERAY